MIFLSKHLRLNGQIIFIFALTEKRRVRKNIEQPSTSVETNFTSTEGNPLFQNVFFVDEKRKIKKNVNEILKRCFFHIFNFRSARASIKYWHTHKHDECVEIQENKSSILFWGCSGKRQIRRTRLETLNNLYIKFHQIYSTFWWNLCSWSKGNSFFFSCVFNEHKHEF